MRLLHTLIKTLAQAILGDYSLYRIYCCDLSHYGSEGVRGFASIEFRGVTLEELQNFQQSQISHAFWYGGEDCLGFGAFDKDKLVGIQWFWSGSRYLERNSWPLKVGDIKSVHMEIDPEYRGRGIGTALKKYSLLQLKARGYQRVISRVWHNNWPSVKLNQTLEAKQIGWFCEINPCRRKKPIKLFKKL